jgi:CBS domain containing-hemolysin-like protein
MIAVAIVLLLVSIFLNAFFSGTETGFFRLNRVRLVLDAIEGDRISKLLLRFSNDPSLYVSCGLIGNNVANNLIALSVVILAQQVSDSRSLELIAPLLLTPFLFVYGDLLPKSLFFAAPNRLLRKAAPLYLFFFVIFSPVIAVLWALARLIQSILGHSPEQVRLTLARHELEQVLREGQEVGLLQPIQRRMAQNFFLVAERPIGQLCLPLHRIHSLPRDTSVRQAISFAQRFKLPLIVIHGERRTELLGYVRTVDLILTRDANGVSDQLRPLVEIKAQDHLGEALMRMQSQRTELAQVINDSGQPLGVISLDGLIQPLLEAPKD